MMPAARIGPTPGTSRLAVAAPIVIPPAAPRAPPTVPPNAPPIPGCSVSVVGTVSSTSSSLVPGVKRLMRSKATPAERKLATARSASARDLKIPATVLIRSPPYWVFNSFIPFRQLFQVTSLFLEAKISQSLYQENNLSSELFAFPNPLAGDLLKHKGA